MSTAENEAKTIPLWDQEVKKTRNYIFPNNDDFSAEIAQKTALESSRLLDQQGWVLWSCRSLDGQALCIARNPDDPDVPDDFPIFSEKEFEQIGDADPQHFRLIYDLKKKHQVKVISSVLKKSGGEKYD